MSKLRSYHLLHLGLGNVGRALKTQIIEQRQLLQNAYGIDLVYTGLFTSRSGLYSIDGLTPLQLATFPGSSTDNAAECLTGIPSPFILIDTTASDITLPMIKTALSRGGGVVLSNKKPLTGSQEDFDMLHDQGRGNLFYETTVGAGLPVVSTLKTILATGDEVISIQGCFSGTLDFIFSELEKGSFFSAAVLEAKKLGFTEPDPRDDLSGTDVARKVLILARLLGRKMELTDIVVEKLYPDSLTRVSNEEFVNRLGEMDDEYQKKVVEAKSRGKVLRYVATLNQNDCRVGITAVPRESEIGSLQGPDNIIVFTTKRYETNPLVIKGPGAGVEVTAAGVFGDIVQAAKEIRA